MCLWGDGDNRDLQLISYKTVEVAVSESAANCRKLAGTCSLSLSQELRALQDAGYGWVVSLFAWNCMPILVLSLCSAGLALLRNSFDLFLVWFLPNFETAAVACEEQELVVAAQACWVSSAAASVGKFG